jgi:diguanylate cyclase (GGDEF)-like protein
MAQAALETAARRRRPERRGTTRSWSGAGAGLVLVTAFYVAAGTWFPGSREGIQGTLAVSLATGVVAALALLVPRRALPALVVAVAAVTILLRLPSTRAELVVAAAYGLANIPAVLLLRVLAEGTIRSDDWFQRRRPILTLIGTAVLVAAVDAVLAEGLLLAAQAAGLLPASAAPPMILVLGARTAAQVDGIVTIAPLVLLLSTVGVRSWPVRVWAELALWVAGLAAVTAAAAVSMRTFASILPLAVLVAFTALLFPIVRLGSLAAAVLTPAYALAAATMMLTLSDAGHQSLGPADEFSRIVVPQLAGFLAAVSAWVAAAVVSEHDLGLRSRNRELQRRVHSGLERFAAALDGMLDPVVLLRPEGATSGGAPSSGRPPANPLAPGTPRETAQRGSGNEPIGERPGFETDRPGGGSELYVEYANGAALATGTSPGSLLMGDVAEAQRRDLVNRCLATLWTGEPLVLDDVQLAPSDGTTTRYVDLRAVRLGAGPDGDLLLSWRDATDRHAGEQELARRALYDPLTGLPNRHLLADHLHLALNAVTRDGGTLAVLYLDLDRFKDVNDSLGHEAGDVVLTTVARRLDRALRAPDTAARLAGDEFVVLARVHDAVAAANLAERIHQSLSAPMDVAGRSLVIRPSIGVTTTSRADTSPEELLRQADLAMYQAKRHGPRSWHVFDDSLQERAVQRLSVLADVRLALAEDRLVLLYQPILDLTNGQVVGAEALLRLRHPARGLLTPDAFIDVVENSDLIVPVGSWVIHTACAQLGRWHRAGAPGIGVAVNVSARQLRDDDIVAVITAATAAAGISPHHVTVEITERVLLDGGPEVSACLHALTEQGCGLAIDDFGTGYSSLTYLKRMPVSTVKIDRSFVSDLGRDPGDRAIVAAVSGLARTLGLTAVAEGVESADQAALVRGLGCHRAQGYFFHPPMPPEPLQRLLSRFAGHSSRQA